MKSTYLVSLCTALTMEQLVEVCSSAHVSQAVTATGFWVVKLSIFLLRASTWAANDVTWITSIILVVFPTNFPLEFHRYLFMNIPLINCLAASGSYYQVILLLLSQ